MISRSFSAETRPTSSDEDNSWLDFLVDLAKLEWCFSEVFDGPGAENERLLEFDQMQGISAECWADARLVPVPCLRILRLDFPVQDLLPRDSRRRRSGSAGSPADLAGDFTAELRGAASAVDPSRQRRSWKRSSRARQSAKRSSRLLCRTTSTALPPTCSDGSTNGRLRGFS